MASPTLPVGVVVQAGSVSDADAADLRRFSDVCLVCDWQDKTDTAIGVLGRAGVAVGMLRWTQDPRGWQGWPQAYVAICSLATFANEPDIEGVPSWQEQAEDAWKAAGGVLVEPAAHSDPAVMHPVGRYDVATWHCYSGDFTNREQVFKRLQPGQAVMGTEYAHQYSQRLCLKELEAAGVTEHTYLFIYRWLGPGSAPGYDLAGLPLDVALSPSVAPQPQPLPAAVPAQETKPLPNPVPQLDQGWTKACWAYAVAECFDAAGHYVSPLDIYAQVKGKLLTPPGDAATFDELRAAINAAAAMTTAKVKWFGPLGVANDPNTVAQLVRDGWRVIAGIQESDLQPGQDYGHYVVISSVADPQAVAIVDSYQTEDGGTDHYPWASLVKAMADNWDSQVDALAFQVA